MRWMVRCYRKTWMMLPIGQRDGRCSSAFPNVKSCITARAVSIINIYSMNYQPIDEVKSEKDLGVTASNDLKVAAHCKEVYAKANRMLGMISRTIKDRNPKTMTSLYKSLVRPHLEYSSVVWNPHYHKDKILLERVQHRFTRLFPDLRSLPYEERLNHLKL